jgi:hypothetical protein
VTGFDSYWRHTPIRRAVKLFSWRVWDASAAGWSPLFCWTLCLKPADSFARYL